MVGGLSSWFREKPARLWVASIRFLTKPATGPQLRGVTARTTGLRGNLSPFAQLSPVGKLKAEQQARKSAVHFLIEIGSLANSAPTAK
jgi:hypothetical protein